MSEKFNMQSQTEHMHMKYVGSGHPDITKFEWIQNQHRDTLASTIGHPHMLHTLAIAQNKSVARVRYEALQKMIQPVGKSPLEQQK